jgi:hypothetical protein
MNRSEQDLITTYLTSTKAYLEYILKIPSVQDEPFLPEIADMIGHVDKILVAVRNGFYTRNPNPPLPAPPAVAPKVTPPITGRSNPYRLTKDDKSIRAGYMCLTCEQTLKAGEWITHHDSLSADKMHGYEDTLETRHYPDCGVVLDNGSRAIKDGWECCSCGNELEVGERTDTADSNLVHTHCVSLKRLNARGYNLPPVGYTP